MAKETRKATRIFEAIVMILMTIPMGYLLYKTYDYYEKTNELEIANEQLLSNIENKKVELVNFKNELKTLNEEYNSYLELENKVSETKNNYFIKAKQLEDKVLNDETDLKIAYLTFDDGPYYKSHSFLDVLEEYDVPATFFYLMKGPENGYEEEFEYCYDSVYRRIIESGHTLGNHTASHKLGPGGVYTSVDTFINDIIKNRNFIYDHYGYTTTVMRFPGGSETPREEVLYPIIDELVELGYGYVDWNSATGDGGRLLSPEQYRDNVLDNTDDKKILVVLMHDYSSNTLIALPEIIEGLSDQGYIFMPLFNESVMVKKE